MTPDEFWNEYETYAQTYLDRPVFKNTPLTGKVLRTSAQNIYNTTKVFIPIDFALAQAQLESSMGKKSRHAETNPFNVGEWDKGTKLFFKTTQEGVDAYYNLLANNYLKNSTPQNLLINFVDFRGNRYASNPNYEKLLQRQIKFVNKYVRSKYGKY